ncbi:MAG: hypothetical protein EGQ20_18300 [Bacteroides oleiciplenus]|nr:hypothetical protein [Bacteroides oleiciplenus]
MEDFEKALVCNHKNDRIPEEYNFFGKLVGAWDLEWNDHLCDAKARRVKGEWIFSWEACRVGDEIVLTEITRQSLKWIFSDITDTSFVWKRVCKQENGNWRLEAKILGTRKTE